MSTDREAAARRAAEAFELLSNEIRTTILLELARDGPASFSELRTRVDVGDSGRFNYHLDKLTGSFVRTDDAGYRLAYHGERVARAVLAGTFTETAAFEPVEVEGACRACDRCALEGHYRDGRIRVACGACGERILSVAFPPTAVDDRSPPEALRAFERWARRRKELAALGVCPSCASRVEGRVDPDPPSDLGLSPLARFACGVCGWSGCTTVGSVVVDHPTVREFHRAVDADPGDGPYWANDYWVTTRHEHVRSRDPWRIDVTFDRDGEQLVVTVDGDLEVRETALTGR